MQLDPQALPGLYCSLLAAEETFHLTALTRVIYFFFLECLYSYVQYSCVSPLKCLLTQNLRHSRFKGPPGTRDRVYLIAGQNMWCHCGITKPVTLLHYRAQHNTAYASTQAARVTATDRRNLLFKFLSCKHTASLWLCCLSSHRPSDCCGEVLLRDYP